MKKFATAVALATLVSTGSAIAAAQWTFKDLDSDGSLELSQKEFSKVSGSVYSKWDADKNQKLDKTEFFGGLYGIWDADNDNRLTEPEYTDAWDGWYDREPYAFIDLDANDDDFLDENEFVGGLGETDIYGTWDGNGDGYYDAGEFDTGLYGAWDADENDVIAQAEYDEADDDGWF